MYANRYAALSHLLLDLFSAEELRLFLGGLPDAKLIEHALPGRSAAPQEVGHQAVEVLRRRGLIARVSIGWTHEPDEMVVHPSRTDGSVPGVVYVGRSEGSAARLDL